MFSLRLGFDHPTYLWLLLALPLLWWVGFAPMVLGLIFLLIGAALGGWGLYELSTGVAYSKRGKEITGGTAKALAIVRIVAGAGCILFALYKMVAG